MPKLIDVISQQELEDIINDYKNNVSLRNLAKKYHHGRNAITKMLEDLDIKITYGNHYRKYFCDFDFFKTIDNELSAYWLGFMYADGCVLSPSKYGQQAFQITLAEKDLNHLELFKKDIKSTYPITWGYTNKTSFYGKKYNIQPQCRQKIYSQKTVDDLKKLGCVERKTSILTFPTLEQVPEEFQHDFIRGYFDGDGSIIKSKNKRNSNRNIYSISFVGTYEFLREIKEMFNYGSLVKENRCKSPNVWYYNIGGNLKVLDFYHYMYDNATRYMQRKYDVFQFLVKEYE